MTDVTNEELLKPYLKKVEQLKTKHKGKWETIYHTIGDCYGLYVEITDKGKGYINGMKEKLNDLAIAEALEKSNSLQNAIVRYVFGDMSRKDVSRYGIVIKQAFADREEVKKLGFVKWLKQQGGIKKSTDKSAEVDKPQFVKDYLSKGNGWGNDISQLTFDNFSIAILGKKEGKTTIREFINNITVVDKVLTSLYPNIKSNKENNFVDEFKQAIKKTLSTKSKGQSDITNNFDEIFGDVFKRYNFADYVQTKTKNAEPLLAEAV